MRLVRVKKQGTTILHRKREPIPPETDAIWTERINNKNNIDNISSDETTSTTTTTTTTTQMMMT